MHMLIYLYVQQKQLNTERKRREDCEVELEVERTTSRQLQDTISQQDTNIGQKDIKIETLKKTEIELTVRMEHSSVSNTLL